MIRSLLKYVIAVLFSLAWLPVSQAEQCRPIKKDNPEITDPGKYTEGMLWEVRKGDARPSYVFGTIHVAHEEFEKDLPGIFAKIKDSHVFAMEALPEPDQVLGMQKMLFFTGEDRLHHFLPPEIYLDTVDILSSYHFPEGIVAQMKPWAAYITMSYPANMSKIMDLQLLEYAQANGIALKGLETMIEQGEIFNQYPMEKQVQLLVDTVCHYELVEENFNRMINLYLKKDLGGIYTKGQKYYFEDNSLYEDLTERILYKRNITMVERMKPLLDEGGAFIAVGAMHLAGNEGILSLLSEDNYNIRIAR